MQKMMNVETTSLDGLAFDGQEFWISDCKERSLKRISLAEQKVLREIKFQPGGVPRALAFTNDALLVLNFDLQASEATDLIQINVMNGKILRTLPCPPELDSGIVWDGSSFVGGTRTLPGLLKFSPATGEVLGELSLGAPITAMAFDHGKLAVVLEGECKSTIALLNPETGEVLAEEQVSFAVGGMAWAEDMLVVTNPGDKEIYITRLKAEA